MVWRQRGSLSAGRAIEGGHSRRWGGTRYFPTFVSVISPPLPGFLCPSWPVVDYPAGGAAGSGGGGSMWIQNPNTITGLQTRCCDEQR